jgi:hypothetical protein
MWCAGRTKKAHAVARGARAWRPHAQSSTHPSLVSLTVARSIRVPAPPAWNRPGLGCGVAP